MEIGFRRLHTQWPGRRDQLSASTPSNSKQPMSTASIGKGRWTPALTEQTGMVQVQPAATWDLLGSRNCVNTKQQQRNLREPVHYQTILLKQKKKKKKCRRGTPTALKLLFLPIDNITNPLIQVFGYFLYILDLIPKRYSLPNLKIRA